MIKILFVCHGNICRSPMAEFLMRHLISKQNLQDKILVSSAATSREEIGNPVHPGTRARLLREGILTDGKYAVQMQRADYRKYDYLIGMDRHNLVNMAHITGGDQERKMFRLLDFTGQPRDIADPWYTGDFDQTYRDVAEGCEAFIHFLEQSIDNPES